MAHFAKVEKGIVTRVIVISNEDCGGGTFPESEVVGQGFIASIGLDGDWYQTSYNSNFRKRLAGVGYSFNGDAFMSPKPYPSWVLDENYDWQPPTPKPDGEYHWDEENQEWTSETE